MRLATRFVHNVKVPLCPYEIVPFAFVVISVQSDNFGPNFPPLLPETNQMRG